MKSVVIIVPAGPSVLSSIVGPYKVFNAANQYLIETGKGPTGIFDVQLVGLQKETSLYNGLFEIRPQKLIDEVSKADLIVVPAFLSEAEDALNLNAAYVPWLKSMYNRGAEIASLCVGAFILASTGLVDGKACTTHWRSAEKFKKLFPKVNLISEKVITDEKGIYSSGGAYSFLNLILYLVEKFGGRETALFCSKLFEVDIDRDNQSHFAIFRGQKDHQDGAVKKAQDYIENNVAEKINIEELADHCAVSKRNFIRRFKNATQNTPIEYIQRVKIEWAKMELESSMDNVSEVMYSVGYSDEKSFRNVFRKVTGLSPLEYKRKYNRHVALI